MATKNIYLYNSVVLSGKSNTGERQQKYDLFEEYFKYPISINEVIHENGRIRERGRAQLQMDYRKRNSHILKGIIYATISVISGLYLVLVPQAVFPWITSLLINVEITFMVFLIAYFILSLKEMYNLVNLIHKSDNSHIDEEIAAVKKQYFKK